MELAVETIVRLSGERARRLGQLAARRGVTEEILVTEALDRLFNESILSADDVDSDDADDLEMLRRIETELGPLPPIPNFRPNKKREMIHGIVMGSNRTYK